jgi:hypothetical protein
MRTARRQQRKKEIALTTDRKARPPDGFLHLPAQLAPERAQAFHFFLRERFHRSVTVD